jgi:tetratricopeptide (TPR) repeat protein
MFTSAADSWGRLRQAFADQFEQDGTNFVYRRSQKGDAIRVSAEERSRFIDEFNRNVRRAKWIIYIGLALVLGAIIGFSLLSGTDLSQTAMFIGIGLVVIPYFVFYRWAWAAPARELGGRTPIAGERSPDEVRRLGFQRITYGQLAVAGFGGVMIPFIGSSRQDVFSGWNRLWLVFGGALVLLAAVQAFRKWRFEEEDSYRGVIPPSSTPIIAQPGEDSTHPSKSQVWRYVPLAVILLGLALIAYTSAGKQLAKQPSFWPILMIGCGGWALFTVIRGISNGQIEPFARGFYNTYQRETQPKRFWASMTWNGIFGCFCLWIAFTMSRDATAQPLRDRCYNADRMYQPQEVLSACNQVIEKKMSGANLTMADAFLDRGIARDALNDPGRAIDDYREALRLQPDYFEAYYDRALAYEQLRDDPHAIADYSAAIRVRPDADAYFNRGELYGRTGDMRAAIADFSEVIRLTPKRADAYYYRAMAYRQIGDTNRATSDFDIAFRLDPKLCGGCLPGSG